MLAIASRFVSADQILEKKLNNKKIKSIAVANTFLHLFALKLLTLGFQNTATARGSRSIRARAVEVRSWRSVAKRGSTAPGAAQAPGAATRSDEVRLADPQGGARPARCGGAGRAWHGMAR